MSSACPTSFYAAVNACRLIPNSGPILGSKSSPLGDDLNFGRPAPSGVLPKCGIRADSDRRRCPTVIPRTCSKVGTAPACQTSAPKSTDSTTFTPWAGGVLDTSVGRRELQKPGNYQRLCDLIDERGGRVRLGRSGDTFMLVVDAPPDAGWSRMAGFAYKRPEELDFHAGLILRWLRECDSLTTGPSGRASAEG